jgi:hypothetical protein
MMREFVDGGGSVRSNVGVISSRVRSSFVRLMGAIIIDTHNQMPQIQSLSSKIRIAPPPELCSVIQGR